MTKRLEPDGDALDCPRPLGTSHEHAGAGAPSLACDRDLLDALSRGDHAALTALYESWFPRALALARALTRRDESFCLDVVQETFVRVIDHAPRLARLAGRDDLDRWMGAIVRSAAIDLLRRELRRAAREAGVASSPRRDGRSDASGDSIEVVRARVAALHADDRELLYLRFASGATLRNTAHAVGTTIGAAYGRIRRSLRTLGEGLQEMDHD